jgi:hypothetical protein
MSRAALFISFIVPSKETTTRESLIESKVWTSLLHDNVLFLDCFSSSVMLLNDSVSAATSFEFTVEASSLATESIPRAIRLKLNLQLFPGAMTTPLTRPIRKIPTPIAPTQKQPATKAKEATIKCP